MPIRFDLRNFSSPVANYLLLWNFKIMDNIFLADQNDRDALLQRLEALESAVARHESLFTKESPSNNESPEATNGAVHFSGQFENASGSISYSWTRPQHHLLEEAWDSSFTRLAALAHPQRGLILKQLFNEPCSVSTLCQLGVTSSTGTAYHHLNELESAGWVRKGRGGVYEVPSERIIPLLTIISASENH